MKTRIITTTLVIFFATATVALATNSMTENPSLASSHENATEQIVSELIPNYSAPLETLMMEDWIDSRNNWEQVGMETTNSDLSIDSEMLEGWMDARDNWEQETVNVENLVGIPSILEDWKASLENWEQK